MVSPSFCAWGSRVRMSPWLAQRNGLAWDASGMKTAAARAVASRVRRMVVNPHRTLGRRQYREAHFHGQLCVYTYMAWRLLRGGYWQLREIVMAWQALFGEKATTKLAGFFDSQEALESVSSELRRLSGLQNTQLWVV